MAFKILPIFGRGKEKITVELFRQHMNKLTTMSELLLKSTEAAMKEKFGIVKGKVEEISKLESQADVIRRKIGLQLFGGAFLPGTRSHLYKLANMMDNVANKIQDSAKTLIYLKNKKFPKDTKKLFQKMVETTNTSIKLLKEVLEDMLENKPQLTTHIKKLREAEHEVDAIKKQIFDSILLKKKIDNLSSRIIGETTNFTSKISDLAEDCCDQIELLKIMKQA